MPARPDPWMAQHAGLAHDVLAPLGRPGDDKDAPAVWDRWFRRLEEMGVPDGYDAAYRRWRESLKADGKRSLSFHARAQGRLLVGHGNPSPTGVGITLSRTWGTPVIPGSSLKGLAASHAEVVYGPGEEGDADPRRAAYGELLRRIFGSPATEGPGAERQAARGGRRGEVIVHDAWWIPPGGEQAKLPLARDVLTVHQRSYYGGEGGPTDHDEPNPVSFLTVRPGEDARFLVALTWAGGEGVPEEEARALLLRAGEHLEEALRDWGVGGKTAAGYGRLVRAEQKQQGRR